MAVEYCEHNYPLNSNCPECECRRLQAVVDGKIDSERELRSLLITAMRRFHEICIHAGTDFETQCLKAVGFHGDIQHVDEYRNIWNYLE